VLGTKHAGLTMNPANELSVPRAAIFVALASPPEEETCVGPSPVQQRRIYRDQDENILIEWSGTGDRQAFDEIVRRYGPFALRIASRLLSNAAAAEDVAQEAMVRAWAQAGNYDARRGRFSTWLYRIIVNLCIDHRRRKTPAPLPEEFDAPDPSLTADQIIENDEKRLLLRKALEDLPDRQRAAVILIYDEGLSGNEAAHILRLSAKGVERLLARARENLRSRLSNYNRSEKP